MLTRKFICLLMTIMLCLSLLYGCVVNQSARQDDSGQSELPDNSDDTEIKLTSLKIGNRDISEYTIIVGVNPFRFDEDIGYDIPANAFAKEISDRLGVTLNVEEFNFDVEYGPTIVFGNNYEYEIVKPYYNEYKEKRKRGTEDENFELIEDFKIFSLEDTIYVLSGSVPLTVYAVESFFDDYIMPFCSSENGDVVLAPDFSYEGSASEHLYTIGCIGDSITYGAGASGTFKTYPAVMQKNLGEDYYRVVNFGCSGKTMCTNHKDAYTESIQYKNLVKYASQLDMVIIWLGTNDADRFVKTWNEDVDEDFIISFRNLLNMLKNANNDMKIIILTPCYCAIEYWEASIETHVLSLVNQIVEETGYTMFDMHSYTHELFTESDFADNLHPSDSGYVIVAEKVTELVHVYE